MEQAPPAALPQAQHAHHDHATGLPTYPFFLPTFVAGLQRRRRVACDYMLRVKLFAVLRMFYALTGPLVILLCVVAAAAGWLHS